VNFIIKVRPDGTNFGLDYDDTFSPMASLRLFIAMATLQKWSRV